MKGLLVKDFRILANQKKLGIMYVIISVILGFSMEPTFIVGYFPMIALFLIMSTISYDEHDNGMTFLMTLPVNGKTYAMEKYVITLIGISATWIFAVGLQIVSVLIQKETTDIAQMLFGDLFMIPVLLFMVTFMIPVELKYGVEKGRVVVFVIAGAVLILFIFGKGILDFLSKNAGLDIHALTTSLQSLPKTGIAITVYVIAITAFMFSMRFSTSIMNRKEY
jgi:hypothetical protein